MVAADTNYNKSHPVLDRPATLIAKSISLNFQSLIARVPNNYSTRRLNYVIVDIVRHSVGEMRGPAGHPLARKCRGWIYAEKHRQHGRGENNNGSFHVLPLLFTIRHPLHRRYSTCFAKTPRCPTPHPYPVLERRGEGSRAAFRARFTRAVSIFLLSLSERERTKVRDCSLVWGPKTS